MSRHTVKAALKRQVYAGLLHLPRLARRREANRIVKEIMLNGRWRELEKGMAWAFPEKKPLDLGVGG